MPYLDNAAGVRTHYEEVGNGRPAVVLHGGLESGETWRSFAESIGSSRRVFLPDRRGHGRTADVEGPYTYEAMAEETAAFLQQAIDEPADLIGFSDGGTVAILVAIDHPELVRSLVSISAHFHYEGLVPTMRHRLANPDPDNPRLSDMRATYGATSPDGDAHWATFYRKVCEMGSSGPELTVGQLSTIRVPTLVIAADDDVVEHHHTIDLFEALSEGQLAIVPGTSHLLLHEAPEQLLAIVERFLDGGPPQRLMPMRTATNGA